MMKHRARVLYWNLIKLTKLFIIINIISPTPVAGQGSEGSGVGISEEEIAKFYTDTKIVSEGQEQEKCSESVMQRRGNATRSLGVEPSVGLGAALLIFIGVGVFAVGIAQAFQMERRYNLPAIILIKSSIHRSGSTSTTTRIISTQLLMREAKSPSV